MTIGPAPAAGPKPKWTVNDYQLLTFNLLIKFGDSVEIYLPGVITQKVAYELSLSKTQEGFLGVTMYITMAASILIAAPFSDR
jgi:predicted CDP-diglyceride synthetase/phosphatidate cytidylyltransferase